MGILLVALDLSTACLVVRSGTQAEAHLLLFDVDFDDLEFVLLACFQLGAGFVTGLGDVAETLNTFRDFDKGAELRRAKNLAVDLITHTMRGEEALPNVGLKLLDSQRKSAILRLDTETTALTFSPFLTISEGCLTRLVQLKLLTCTKPSMPKQTN